MYIILPKNLTFFTKIIYKNLLDTLKSNIEEDKIEENEELWNINEDSYWSDDIEELKYDKKKIHQLDSPFIQNENRSKDDILCFIEILRNYLDLKTSDKKVYIDLLNWSDSDAEFLTKLFKFAKLKRK